MGQLNPDYTSLQGISLPKDAFVIIVTTEWNTEINLAMLNGCKEILDAAGVQYQILTVPGAVEIPFTIKSYYNQASKTADAFIAFGCVIRGDTPHFDYVCNIVSDSITQLNLTLAVPIIFGVLTVNTEQQALDRVGGIEGHKGKEAAVAALKMINLNRQNKGA